ncbi:hypothetical protein ACWGJW_37000 [Streptomyces nigrescens]
MATKPIERSPRRHSSKTSALNSGVNERLECGFFFTRALLSIVDNFRCANP